MRNRPHGLPIPGTINKSMNSIPVNSPQTRKHLTLLHTSDLHLGADVFPEDKMKGFEQVLDLAVTENVDALLIAGDMFDAYGIADTVVTHALDALARLRCPTVIVPGNHDTLLVDPSFSFDSLPKNVHIFRDALGELIVLPDLGLCIWGRPVYEHEPSFHPLEGLEPKPDHGWYVAMAHGLFIERSTTQPISITKEEMAQVPRDYLTDGDGLSSPITWVELARADCDYIALGHVHVFRDVTQGECPAFYSGAPSGWGNSGAAVVTLDPTQGISVKHHKLDWFPA